MKKIFYVLTLVAATLVINSCADSYLNQEPGGSTITENQYNHMDNAVEGLVKGIIPNFYSHFADDHMSFGQRAIDMYGDLLCGDMAMKTQNYGWFAEHEQMQTYNSRGLLWGYYYGIVRSCNKAINALETQGIPELVFDPDTLTDAEYLNGFYYAEALTLRGWAYSKLCGFFVASGADEASLSIPVYTESDTRLDTIAGGPRATVGDLYLRIETDFLDAIQYFEAYNLATRGSKIEVDEDIARILLAYAYLNQGDNTNALKYAKEAIDLGTPFILPVDKVLTTGFNNVENENWIWGQDVTVETTTALASFFGQCDIYSYSYASAGDVKGIDKNLYDAIQGWDIRKLWWNNYAQSGKSGATMFAYAPDGKFYSAKSKTLQGDKDWLSDNVYMRWELAYLIAAEAAARTNDLTSAQNYLYAITDQRVVVGQETAYDAWKAGLADQTSLLAAIKHNWRVELWGEGYGLQTFRRYGEAVTLGDNHLRAEKNISPTAARRFTFELPTSEYYYNPFLRTSQDQTQLHKKI